MTKCRTHSNGKTGNKYNTFFWLPWRYVKMCEYSIDSVPG